MDNRPLEIRAGLYHDVDPADVVMRNQDLLRNASNIANTSNKQHENITSSDFYFEKVTKPSEVYRYSTSNETGLPTSGEMVYYPRPTHPLEEDNQRLKEENERLAKWVDSQCKTMDALREEIATLRKRHGYKEGT
jgi:hypothetical protein